MIISVIRWSWKGCLSVTLGKPILHTFIVWVSGRQSFELLSQETYLQVNTIVEMGGWSWKVEVSSAHSLHRSWGDRRPVWNLYHSFSGKSIMKRPFLSDTEEASVLHLYWSGLPGDRVLNKYNSFRDKMVLKRLFVSDTGEDLSLYIHCSDLRDTKLVKSKE